MATSHLRKVIDAAAVLEVGLVNTFIGRDPALSVDANWPRFLEVWKPLIGYAEARGVKVAIENCPMLFDADQWPGGKNLATTPAIWRRMFDAIPSPNFGLNFDPSHFIWQQVDYVKPLAEFKDRIFHVHAKDARIDQSALERARAAVVSQTLAHAQDSRHGRRALGSFLRRLERCRLPGSRRDRSRGSGLRGFDRIAARFAQDQPAILASVSRRAERAPRTRLTHRRQSTADRTARRDRVNAMTDTIDLSVLIPVFNEVDNVEPLHAELDAVLRGRSSRYELIFVDDGSTDGTTREARGDPAARPGSRARDPARRNCGQTAALTAALDQARGEILVPIDGDRQNDPADIPRLLEQIDAGYDVVSGWRKQRHDALITRKVPSWLANRLVARLSGVPLHDFGCTLKAYRRRVLEGVRLYGEMHRFIAIFAAWQGGRVIELVVNHRPRTAGRTKYGLGRTFNVVLDLILIRFLQRYSQRPLHFFGRFGLWSFGLGMLSFLAMLYFKYVFPWPYLWWGADEPPKSFIADSPALADGHVLPGGLHVHSAGYPGRSDHAHVLRVAGEDHLPAQRFPGSVRPRTERGIVPA